jgi:chromosome segregation ATPase
MSGGDRYPQGEGPAATIQEFGRAAGRLVTALAIAASSAEATALECVFELHEAFGQLTSALAVLPEVISRADAGSRVDAQLRQRQAEVAAAAAELAALRANLDALGEVERDLRATEAERAVLAARLAELEQASARAAELSAMRDRIAALEEAVSPADAADDLAGRLTRALALLQELTGKQRTALGPQLEQAVAGKQEALEALEHTKERKEALESDLNQLVAEEDEITKAIKHGLPALAEWRAADAAVADALATVGAPDLGSTHDRLRALLAELTDRMKAVDDALGPLHARYVEARNAALAVRTPSSPAP